jgi:hypothetical protein
MVDLTGCNPDDDTGLNGAFEYPSKSVSAPALAVETHENWLEATRYLNMAHLAEHKKEARRKIEQAEAA